MTTAIDRLTLHLVRHGETAGNAERRFQHPETPLSDLGREQAAAVAETIATTTTATLILASDYARTMETASIISARTGLPIVEEPALRGAKLGHPPRAPVYRVRRGDVRAVAHLGPPHRRG